MNKQRKADKTEFVHQAEKVKFDISPRELKWTDKQKRFIELCLDKETKLVFCSGPAGSGKTTLATYVCLKLLSEKKISDIVYLRTPIESADTKIGMLPGDISDKMHAYSLPFLDKLDELLPKAQVDKLVKDNKVASFPVNFIRGMSWNARGIQIDECQNLSLKEIITITTRIGKYSKAFLLFDPDQSDLPPHKSGAIIKVHKLLNNDEARKQGIHTFEFGIEDIMRSELVRYLVGVYATLKP